MENTRAIENIKQWISRYSILRNGKWVENKIIGWQTALAHARRWQTNLFDDRPQKVEILNIWTGEIITIEEAEERAKKYEMRRRQSTQPIQTP